MRHCASIFAFFGVLLSLSNAQAQVPFGPGDWPQWRGPQRDGISTDTGLMKDWPEAGPSVAWQVDTVGVGYSSLAIKDGRIFTLGDLGGIEHIICLSVKEGSLLWAVQPEPVAAKLAAQVAEQLKRTDANGDGVLDEAEALAGFGWDVNKFDQPVAGNAEEQAGARAARLVKLLDKNGDDQISPEEGGRSFFDVFDKIDARDEQANAEQLAASRAASLMKTLDGDADGKISRQEARNTIVDRLFSRVDERDPATNKGDEQLTSAELQAYLAKSEAGKDGLLTAAELAAYYARNLAGRDGTITAAELRGFYGGYRNGQGDGPRGTPTVDGDRVYAEGANGDLCCLDAATGKTIWHVNLVSEMGGGRPGWGYSESPLIEGNLVVVTPGGKGGTLAALDKMTGQIVWRSGDLNQGAHYSSPVVADIGGIRQIVQFASKSVFGVELGSGRRLWEYSGANNGTANCATPIVSEDSVFTSSGYGTGGGLARIVTDGSVQTAEEVYFEKKMANHHGGLVKVGDYMYGFGTGLMCMNYATGEIAWQARSVSKGSLVVADGMLYLLGEGHEVALAEATPEGYQEHGRFRIPSFGRPSWAHPVVAGGRLYIRNMQQLTAYDVRAKSSAE